MLFESPNSRMSLVLQALLHLQMGLRDVDWL